MAKKILLIHYHELALKGENRPFFEKALINNITAALSSHRPQVEAYFGRITAAFEDGVDEDAVRAAMMRVCGVANFAFAQVFSGDFETITAHALEFLKQKEFQTFRVTARRADKGFPLNSQQINEQLGARIVQQLGKRVDLHTPDITCFVEIVGKNIFLYFAKEQGIGGLPTGTSGRVMSLISSGFDSPVAAWKMMRRGCEVVFVHFHSYPYTTDASRENVKEIVKVLARFQNGARLFLVPFLPIQKAITAAGADERLRVVLYRRHMARIAERIAQKEKCGALVTGESLGQVASQTLENLAVISSVVSMPFLRPLIGENKDDIISLARSIGTAEISAMPYEDCCSLFLPEHPRTKAQLEDVMRAEESYAVTQLESEAVAAVEVVEISIEA